MTNLFESILDRNVEDIQRPKPIPQGTYVVVVDGLPEQLKSSQKQTEYLRYKLRFVSPQEDVNVTALEEAGGIADTTMNRDFYLTEKSVYRLKDFLVDDLGLNPKKKALWDLAQEANGCECLAHVRHRPSDNGKGFFAEIDRTASLKD